MLTFYVLFFSKLKYQGSNHRVIEETRHWLQRSFTSGLVGVRQRPWLNSTARHQTESSCESTADPGKLLVVSDVRPEPTWRSKLRCFVFMSWTKCCSEDEGVKQNKQKNKKTHGPMFIFSCIVGNSRRRRRKIKLRLVKKKMHLFPQQPLLEWTDDAGLRWFLQVVTPFDWALSLYSF